ARADLFAGREAGFVEAEPDRGAALRRRGYRALRRPRRQLGDRILFRPRGDIEPVRCGQVPDPEPPWPRAAGQQRHPDLGSRVDRLVPQYRLGQLDAKRKWKAADPQPAPRRLDLLLARRLRPLFKSVLDLARDDEPEC